MVQFYQLDTDFNEAIYIRWLRLLNTMCLFIIHWLCTNLICFEIIANKIFSMSYRWNFYSWPFILLGSINYFLKKEGNMSIVVLENETQKQDIRKVKLECAALERSAWTYKLKVLLMVIGANSFLIAFWLDRYKIAEQRKHDRKISIANKFDTLYSRTLAVMTEVEANTVFFRVNVQTFKEKLEEFEKKY